MKTCKHDKILWFKIYENKVISSYATEHRKIGTNIASGMNTSLTSDYHIK